MYKYIVTILFLIISLVTSAQSLLHVKHYSTEDGLSQNIVQCITQDNDGYIWLATWNGLEKFDGYQFRNYKSYPTDTVRLDYNRIIYIKKGFGTHIWCQTYSGKVYLFDSKTEQYYNVLHEPENRFYGDRISKLIPMDKGVMWIINPEGKHYRIDEHKCMTDREMAVPYTILPSDNHTYTIADDAWGNEWILTNHGTYEYGKNIATKEIFQYIASSNTHTYFATENEVFAYTPTIGIHKIEEIGHLERIDGLHILSDGNLSIATNTALIIYNTGENSVRKIDYRQRELQISLIYDTSDGAIWTFNGTNEVLRAASGDNSFQSIKFVESSSPRNCFIHEDSFGCVWVQHPNGHFSYYDKQANILRQARYRENGEEKIYHDPGRNFFIDRDNNLWLCGKSGFDYLNFTHRNYDLIGKNGDIRGLFIDSHQHLWRADKEGIISLYDLDGAYIGNLSADGNIVADNRVVFGSNAYAFFEDRLHRIWIGTKEHGLYIATPIHNKKYRIVHYQNNSQTYGLCENSIYAITADKLGRIWIGTYGGGVHLVENPYTDNLRFIHHRNKWADYPQEALKVRSILSLDNGVILAGTTGGLLTFGANFAQPDEVKFYLNRRCQEQTSSLSNNDVMYIYRRKNGDLYIVPYSGGISRIESHNLLTDSLSFTHYNRQNGLPSDLAYSLIEDDDRNLWIIFENSICQYNPESGTTDIYNHYNLHTTLPITECPPILDKMGRMYIGLESGLLRLNIAHLQKSCITPPIVFTRITSQNDYGKKEVSPIIGNKLILNPQQRNINIGFVALDYTNPTAIHYAYRLQGINNSWNNLQGNHTVSFAGLPAGNWNLEVRSTNGDGVWVDNTHTLTIVAEPTFRETPWAVLLYIFIGICIIALITGIFLYISNLRRSVSIEQQVTQLKLRFFTDISHELRTPLTLISAPIEETLQHEQLTEEGRKNLETAQRNTHRMLRLINQILDFRKIQNDKMRLYIRNVDIAELLQHTFESFEHLAGEHRINYSFENHLPITHLYTDADKVEKIVFNLLSNAFKYTPDGKSITLSATIDNNRLAFAVKDEGTGISPEKAGEIFNRFETLGRQDNSLSTGIGLSLVKELINLLHGSITVESIPGEGSTFTVYLPIDVAIYRNDPMAEFTLTDGESPIGDESVGDTPSTTRETLLIVEDNGELRNFIRSILQEDYSILTARDGVEGLQKAKEYIPTLIISDIMMPRMDGIELLNAIKQSHDTSHIPTILLSAKSSIDDRIKGLDYGADDYITKPFSSSYLKARIRTLLQKRKDLRTYYLAQEDAKKPTEPENITKFDDEFIKQIIGLIEKNLQNNDFKIEDMAETLHMSRTVFYRKIKSITDISPIDLVQEIRLKEAVRLLETGGYRVSEIAYQCGFSSPQYFSRVFKDKFGCTPSEYKKN